MFFISVGPGVAKSHWVNTSTIFGGLIVVINYQWKKEELGVIIPKTKEYKLVFSSNEDVSAASFLSFRVNNIEYHEKQDIFPNT